MSTSTAAISKCFRYRSLILSHLNRSIAAPIATVNSEQQQLKLRSFETRIPNQPIFGIQNDVAIRNQINLAALIDGDQLPMFARGQPVKIDDDEEDVEAFDEDSDEFESEDEDEFDEMDGEDEVDDDDEDEDLVYKKRK